MDPRRSAAAAWGPADLIDHLPGVELRWIFEGPLVRISRWRCHPDRGTCSSERSLSSHSIVFLHAGSFRVRSSQETGLLDCSRVAFFNSKKPFQTTHPFGGGDCGSEIAIRPDVVSEIVARHDPSASDRIDAPFTIGSGPCLSPAFLLQRLLVRTIDRSDSVDVLKAEELAITLVERLVEASFYERDGLRGSASRVTDDDRDTVERIKGHLARYPGRSHLLSELAQLFGMSPFQICRTFRAVTGTTLHRHLTHVRVQQAIHRLAAGCDDLTGLALNLGFSSHSHFTSRFRKAVAMTPANLRRLATSGSLEALRERMPRARTAARS